MLKFQQPNICPLHIRVVAPSFRSLMGGEVGLTSRWEDKEKLSTFMLVVTARESNDSPNSASVKLFPPSDQQNFTELQSSSTISQRPDWRSCRLPWSLSNSKAELLDQLETL